MDVLERRVPLERPAATSSASASRPVDQAVTSSVASSPPAEAADVRDCPGDVVGGQRGVDLDRAREFGHALVRLAAEPPPQVRIVAPVVRRTCYPPGRTLLA